jgi:hypothetical protein
LASQAGAILALLYWLRILFQNRRPQSCNEVKMSTVHDFTASSLEKPLSDFSGQVLLVVNTASKCGGFPCNQFGGQEPGDAAERAARFAPLVTPDALEKEIERLL